MNELSSLGLILLLALLAGHLVKFIRVPEVTGYILAGVVVGPSILGWVSHENLVALEVLSEVALGLILFSIGSVFQFARFRRFGRRILYLTLAESGCAALAVGFGLVLFGQAWQIAALLGVIAIATAPASTLMVIRECNGRGPLSDTLLAMIAVNNIICLVSYSLVSAAIDVAGGQFVTTGLWSIGYSTVFPIVWQIAGSISLGYLAGLMLSAWASQVTEHGEILILLAGTILLCVGVSRILDLSPLIASLAVGSTMVNLSRRSLKLFEALARTDPPFYAIFFVIAGADLDVSLIGSIGMLGAYYVLARPSGKFFGARFAARQLRLDPRLQKYLGFGLFAQADLAVGLTLAIDRQFPEFATVVSTVVLSGVVIYEIIGPISTRFAIEQSGEARAEPTQTIDALT